MVHCRSNTTVKRTCCVPNMPMAKRMTLFINLQLRSECSFSAFESDVRERC